MHERILEQLSEYLDGQLTEPGRREVERHLEECAGCRAVHDDLADLRRAASALGPIEPARDLWPDIEDRLEPAPRATGVIPLHLTPGEGDARGAGSPMRGEVAVRRRTPDAPRRRSIRLTLPQAVAATLVLVAGSAVVTSSVAPRIDSAIEEPVPYALHVGGRALPEGLGERADEVERLARAVSEAREALDASTVELLERNLRRIDEAIVESLEALESDPGNPYVRDHLERTLERRAGLLRDVRTLAMAD